MNRFLRLLVVSALLPFSLLQADEVVLKGGSTLEGVVLRANEEQVGLLLPAGDVLALKRADVERVVASRDAPKPGKHIRYKEPKVVTGARPGGGLEVAMTHYLHPQGGARIDLIAAVHIADPAYFREVQKILEDAAVVLYEGVKRKDQTPADFEKPEAEPNPVRELQGKLAKWFGLKFQLEAISYTRPHFVHADLTAEEFLGETSQGEDHEIEAKRAGEPEGKADRDPAESAGGAFKQKKSPGGGLMGQAKGLMDLMKIAGPMLDMLMGQPGPMRSMMKKRFAQTLGTVDIQKAMSMVAPGASDLLLTRRNAVVIKRIEEQRTKAKGPIAIFYGAAHLADIEAQIVEKFGYRRAGARWLRAWHIK